MTDKEITEHYEKMVIDIEESNIAGIQGKTNCYRCEGCERKTKYIYKNTGVTPFLKNCEHCGNTSKSSLMYDIAPELEPAHEWYRPSLEETINLKDQIITLDHILNGGLLERPILSPKTTTHATT